MKNIYLLTGPIKTGKTTKLMSWVRSKKNVGGILQPVIDGKRYLYFIDNGEKMPLELEKVSDKLSIEIGNYKFDQTAFEWAKGSLVFSFSLNPEIFVIDEFGKLELNGRGLEPVISQIVNDVKSMKNIKLILVVRDYLVEEAVKYLNLDENDFQIISSDELFSVSNQL